MVSNNQNLNDIFTMYNIDNTIEMDKQRAACIIQRWFRRKLSKVACTISHQSFISDYEIVLDKQVYNANELYRNLMYSTKVPHSRRELTQDELELIDAKRDPCVSLCKPGWSSSSFTRTQPVVTFLLDKDAIINATCSQGRHTPIPN